MRLIPILLAPLLFVAIFVSSIFAQTRDYTRWVNPFIGTGGHGHTFPGATMPFGMVQLSPDTRIDNWDGSSGYHYSDDVIYGFSHTHLSGTGIPDGCDILFMPTIGEPQFFAKEGDKSVNGYASKFSHANEKAEAGYYSVKLEDDGILAEMTATKRVGFHRYAYPRTERANLILDLRWRDKWLEMDIAVDGDKRVIEGSRRSSSWAKNQTVYFAAEFSQPFNYVELGNGLEMMGSKGSSGRSNTNGGLMSLQFDTNTGKPLLLKVAISYVSIEGARKNLAAELPGWDFDKVRADAKASWNKELSKIDVSGGTDEQATNFYSALYHTMIHPNVFNDVDGQYKGHDGKIHQLRSADTPVRMSVASTRTSVNESKSLTGSKSFAGGTGDADKSVRAPSDHYTVFSLWDTFRAAHPLYTIIDQKRTVDYINTFLRIYEQGGRLPVWELWGEETDTMIGYHSVSVIADAMAKGIEGFDYEKAYAAAKHSANLDHHGLGAYKKRGYVSGEDDNESVSKTMEYAYNDWCIAQMAAVLYTQRAEKLNYTAEQANKDPILQKYSKEGDHYSARAGYYENLFDAKAGFMRPKRNGGFIEPFAPNEVTFHFTEGNSWQYSFFVPHDIRRVIELYGSKEKFAAKLDELFTTEQKLTGREQPDITGLIGQYAHGNEPSHHIPYLYNYAGHPWKTQTYVRKIMDEFYKNAPDGLIGNEDAGQMSAWYVLSASGFYPINPGDGVYVFGSPLFREVKYNLENGKTFVIRAKDVSRKNFYIRGAKLNNRSLDAVILTHEDMMAGGILEFDMTDTPAKSAFPGLPVTTLPGNAVTVPVLTGDRVFKEKAVVELSTAKSDSKIRYTMDGSTPTLKSPPYSASFTISETTTVKAITEDFLGRKSMVAEATFHKRPNDWTVKLISEFNSQYPGSSYDAIIDGLRGNQNFAAGEWQGYWGKTFEAVIDLKRETEIREVGGSFLQSARSWIWMPDRLEFEVSSDGTNFKKLADFKPGFPQTEMNGTPKEFLQKVSPVTARYVRVRAYNIGKIPEWHVGSGGDPWIFVDEIFIR